MAGIALSGSVNDRNELAFVITGGENDEIRENRRCAGCSNNCAGGE